MKSLEFRAESLMLFFIIIFLFTGNAHAAQRTVCASGADYTTIQAAINAASSSDEIVICDGTYNEAITINKKNLIIKSQSGNRNNVIIQNSTSHVVTITNWPDSITLKDLSIFQSGNNKYGIYVESEYPTVSTLFDNISVTTQNYDAIHFRADIPNLTIQNSYIKTLTGEDGIDFTANSNGGFSLIDTTIEASDHGVEITGSFNSGLRIVRSSITGSDRALSFDSDIWTNGLIISDSNISGGTTGVHVGGQISGGLNVTHSNISAAGTNTNDNAIYLAGSVSGGINIIGSKLLSNLYGMYTSNSISGVVRIESTQVDSENTALNFRNDMNSGIILQDVNLSSQAKGISFNGSVWSNSTLSNVVINSVDKGIEFINPSGNFTFDTVKITSSGGMGIDVNAALGTFSLTKVDINASNRSLNFLNKDNDPVIINSKFYSSNAEALYIQLKEWNNFSATGSCFTTAANSVYAVNNKTDSWSSFSFNNNCIYAKTTAYLARSDKSGLNWSGNYWDGVSGNYTGTNISDTTPLASCTNSCASSNPIPIAEYRFDECGDYNGTLGEVKDHNGNYNGALKKKSMTLQNSKLCRGPVDFNGDSYIDIPSFPNLTGAMTITAWFKTTDISKSGQRIFADDISNSGGYAISVGDGGSGTIRFYDRSQTNNGIIDSDAVLENNTWYFVAGVTDTVGAKRYLYVYDSSGTLKSQKSVNMDNTSRGSDTGVATIGGEADGGETDNRFKGSIDEVKIFTTSLTQTHISTIMQNERDGKNYDGTNRTCNPCGLQACFTDTFDRTDLGSKWSIIKAENFTPTITTNKLMLTNKTGYIAAGVSLIGDFPSANNLIEIEFENNAYGGNGADGIVVVFSDANVTPVAGANGGSLGYAQKSGVAGFAGGWLGFGLDEYGNFSNPNEGRVGGPGFIKDAFAIRGSAASNYAYINGTSTLTPGIDNNATSTATSTSPLAYKYKMTIDTRNNKTLLSVDRDSNDGNGYKPIVQNTDATQTATAPQNFKLSLTGGTGGSNNFHSLDNLSIKALSCGTLGQDKNTTNNFFDAWDTSGDIAHRSIQTKIVKQDFTLNVVGLNAANTAYQDFNGTVCARLVDSNDKNLTAWNKLLFTGANLKTTTFNSNYASKDARVALSWKKNTDTTCPISVEDNSTKSTDHFAIRPKDFTISAGTTAYAGDNFTLDFKARNSANGAALDYNESKDGSFKLTSVIGKSGCTNGVLTVNNFNFSDGQKLLVDANYTDVGDVNITIAEKPTFEFATIDKSDTSDANRFIAPATFVLSVLPYELNVTDANFTASTGQNWLYDANVSDMYATAHATVQANNKQHQALQNFTASCYAQPVDLSFYYDVNNTNANVNLSYVVVNGAMTSAVKTLSDMNKTITIPATSFSTARASADYRFNIDRAYNVPLSPVDIALRDVKVTSLAVAKDENNATVNHAKRFYYGRLKTKDIATDKTPASHAAHVEVFSPTAPGVGFYQNTLNWWINASDDGVTSINDVNLSAYKDFVKTVPSTLVSVGNKVGFSDGKLDFSLLKNSSAETQATFHLDIPSWLWYSTLKDYNTSSGSTCAYHPCFEYRFLDNATTIGIKSGELKGATIGKDFNSTYQKSGVKTFR